MSCPHGHASRPEEEFGSGECYTCLERVDVCACNFCIAGLNKKIFNPDPNDAFAIEPQWRLEFIQSQCGDKVTKENYLEALWLSWRYCDCQNKDNPAHDEQECLGKECTACAMVRCPRHEPLHFHHDGCPACCDAESIDAI